MIAIIRELWEDTENRIPNVIFGLFIIPLTLIILFLLTLSLKWRILHDSPILLYATFLIDHFGAMPYKDIFEMNMPGTILIYYIIGKLTNYTDLGVRIQDVLFLVTLLTVAYLWLRYLGKRVALASILIFAFFCLSEGPYLALQREYLMLLPLNLAILLAVSVQKLNNYIRLMLIGFLFGICFIIKPHSLIFFPAIILYFVMEFNRIHEGERLRSILMSLASSLVGLLIPLSLTFLFLQMKGILKYFLDIVLNYLPLYSQLNGENTILPASKHLHYMVTMFFKFGDATPDLILASIGVIFAFFSRTFTNSQKRIIWLVISLLLIASLYPAFSGQFWHYHYTFLYFFVTVLGCLCLAKLNIHKFIRPIPIIISIVYFSFVIIPLTGRITTYSYDPPGGNYYKVDEMAYFLKNNLKEGDLVQPLDWTGGAVHAMLIAKAKLATPYIYDFYFYHNVSNPYIQGLRKDFIKNFDVAKPKYVIQFNGQNKPWPKGDDTTNKFPELQSRLKLFYEPALEDMEKDYIIWKRIK